METSKKKYGFQHKLNFRTHEVMAMKIAHDPSLLDDVRFHMQHECSLPNEEYNSEWSEKVNLELKDLIGCMIGTTDAHHTLRERSPFPHFLTNEERLSARQHVMSMPRL